MSEDSRLRDSPTFVLIAINVGLYIVTSIVSGSIFLMSPQMIVLLGFSKFAFLSGRFYVLITSIFFHASVAHVGSNMLFLLIYGSSLEESGFRKNDIFTIYLVTGLLATLFSLPFLGDSTVTLGASGAVFGMLGAIIGYEWNQGGENKKRVLFVGIINFIFSSTSANTNIFAHLFGLAAGILITKYPFILDSEYAVEFREKRNMS